MNNYTLIIIDMQRGFDASSCKRTQNAIIQEIKLAKKNDCGILLVEFHRDFLGKTVNEYGKTLRRLKQHVKEYDRYDIVKKYERDGSGFIETNLECFNTDFNTKTFRICGINSDECVAATVESLHKIYENSMFEIIVNACNYSDNLPGYNPFSGYPNSERIKYLIYPEIKKPSDRKALKRFD